ncbi:MAG: branched-chain amino acid transport system II carrier protein, partial [Enterobacteriaceae bacterium]|nr:branched-chain amino acid transport system II carrier protein [Enterobacteriaceae bacterium]
MTKIKSEIYIKIKTSISIGFALFAMLFGAGNIIFPLYLGANTEKNIPIAIIGFLLTGVGAPFLGLFATTLFNGDYWNFFCRLGKVPAIIIVSFLIIIIGPLIAIPRTESIIWNSVSLYLPEQIQYHYVFSIAYCLLLLILSIKETKIINILGLILSPIKIITFSILIIIGLFFTDQTKTIIIEKTNLLETFNKSILIGYSTMDLLATFFFANIAFKSIQTKNENKTNITIITLASAI